MAKISTTYAEDPDNLTWLDGVAQVVSEHRGSEVSRADVIRWAIRRTRARVSGYSTAAISAEI